MKKLCMMFFLFLFFGSLFSQTKNVSDVLESTLSGVITVAVYNTDYGNMQLMSRGENTGISEEAYKKALQLGDYDGAGSGFIVEFNGVKYVITNYHVISDASSEEGSIKIFSISRKEYEVRVLGGDSFYDLAVLEFVDKPGPEISSLKFRTKEARIGEKVFAIGNPLGDYPYSVSDGIISAKNRVRDGLTGKFGYFQTTATVIWGNSGGPLIDDQGNVVGINTYIDFTTDPDGGSVWLSQINFSLESTIAKRLTEEIISNKGRVVRSYLGFEFSKKTLWADEGGSNAGVQKLMEPPVISGVLPNSPAYTKFKNKIGYSIKSINGEEVRNLQELLGSLEATKPDQEIIFVVGNDSLNDEKIRIVADELKDQQLEDIARFLFNKEKSISLIEHQSFVGLDVKISRFRSQDAYTSAVNTIGSVTKWKIVTAGLNGDYMYKVESMKDLGAAIKLTSLSGVLDVVLIQDETEEMMMKSFRYIFSDQDSYIEALLYY